VMAGPLAGAVLAPALGTKRFQFLVLDERNHCIGPTLTGRLDVVIHPKGGPMAKADLVTVEGKVSDLTGGGVYSVTLENGVPIKARLCGKMKRFNIKVVVGDRVNVGVSPYDPTHGIILHRHKI